MKIFNNKINLLLTILSLFCCFVAKSEIKMAITFKDGDKHNYEFINNSYEANFYKKQNITPAYYDLFKLTNKNYNYLKYYAEFKKYHVIILRTLDESIHKYNSKHKENAKNIGKALVKYVEQGGGLILQISSVRYPNDGDEKFWNECLKPLGIQILHEGIHDLKNSIQTKIKHNLSTTLSHTSNIKPHEITKDVKGLLLPLYGFVNFPGTPAYSYSKDWEVIVRGEKSAKSYLNNEQNYSFTPKKVGTYPTEPPIVAIRNMGKGRIVAIAMSYLHTGLNYKNQYWSNKVEYKGLNNKPSNSMQLFANAVKWAADNAIKNPNLGKYKYPKYSKVKHPENISFDNDNFLDIPNGVVKGIWGLHSNYSDGKGTVAQYSNAAKKAGLSFIVFTDPLELLNPEKLKKLVADCKAVSNNDFYACPGVEFTDNCGNRWIAWSERISWPLKSFTKGIYTYKQWDGKKINHFGTYMSTCGLGPSALLDYKQLPKNGSTHENMWWFYNIIPKVYEGDKLIADNSEQQILAHKDLRYVYPITFNRIKSPEELPNAIKVAGVCCFNNINSAKKTLNHRGGPTYVAADSQQFITNGNIKIYIDTINNQMENNWLFTKGAQRVKLKFKVDSPDGIKSVKVIDAFGGVLRNFSPKGANTLTQEIELVHDRKHLIWLEVEDNNGKTATSHTEMIWCYKQGLFRCNDNLNMLGALGLYWHPDRNQMLPIVKMFQNAEKFSVMGWDRANADCPMPETWPLNSVNIKGVGEYPDKREYTSGAILDIDLVGHDVQICNMKMNDLYENCDTDKRPGPAQASISRKLKENEYFSRTDTMHAFRDNADFFIIWNHRRRYEGTENFYGSFVLHEGEIEFKKDITLDGSVPIKLALLRTPFLAGELYDKIIVNDLNKGKVEFDITANKTPSSLSGIVKGGGYISILNSPIGCISFLTPKKQNLSYSFSWPNNLVIGLGQNGEKIKKGQKIKYSYIATITTDSAKDSNLLEQIVKTYNLDDSKEGYPLTLEAGKLIDNELYLTLQAEKNEVKFTAGPAKNPIIDLPIKVMGIADNGCAAIYSSIHPYFNFVPVEYISSNLLGTAILQESIAQLNDIWIGNVFVSDNNNIKMTLVKDGQDNNKQAFLEIHNPTNKEVKTEIHSPSKTPIFGGKSFVVTIPANDSIKYNL